MKIGRKRIAIHFATDYGHTMTKYLILSGPNSTPTPKWFLRFVYNVFVFCRNNGWFVENMGHGTHSTKMGADKSAKNTPNAPKLFGRICQPKSKSLGFSKKALYPSVVRVFRTAVNIVLHIISWKNNWQHWARSSCKGLVVLHLQIVFIIVTPEGK